MRKNGFHGFVPAIALIAILAPAEVGAAPVGCSALIGGHISWMAEGQAQGQINRRIGAKMSRVKDYVWQSVAGKDEMVEASRAGQGLTTVAPLTPSGEQESPSTEPAEEIEEITRIHGLMPRRG